MPGTIDSGDHNRQRKIQGWNLGGCPLQRSMVESGQSFRPILLEIRDTSVVRADQPEVHKWQQ